MEIFPRVQAAVVLCMPVVWTGISKCQKAYDTSDGPKAPEKHHSHQSEQKDFDEREEDSRAEHQHEQKL